MPSEYQQFEIVGGKLTGIRGRMADKLSWMPPLEASPSVLDIGCDAGFWCFWAREHGATHVVGIDRGRAVRGRGYVDVIEENRQYAEALGLNDVIEWKHMALGTEYHDVGRFDRIFCMSMYHHAYEAAGGDHEPIVYWLRNRCTPHAEVIWEGPIDTRDGVVAANVAREYWPDYHWPVLLEKFGRYFKIDFISGAVHEKTRWAYRLTPKPGTVVRVAARPQAGAGGATRAFMHANCRRINEIKSVLGFRPFPGSLNIKLSDSFDWAHGYYRARISDVIDRAQGFNGAWGPRWCRFAPVTIGDLPAYAMRFEGERYAENFVELIAAERLRDNLPERPKLTRII